MTNDGTKQGLCVNKLKDNLQNHKTECLRRLKNLIVKLRKSRDLLKTYNKIIRNYLKEGIVEKMNKIIPSNIP